MKYLCNFFYRIEAIRPDSVEILRFFFCFLAIQTNITIRPDSIPIISAEYKGKLYILTNDCTSMIYNGTLKQKHLTILW